MDQLQLWLTVSGLWTLAVLCAVAVLSPAYHDTLVQRAALGGVCIGAAALACWCWRNQAAPGAILVLAVSGAAFALETARKVWLRVRRGTWSRQ